MKRKKAFERIREHFEGDIAQELPFGLHIFMFEMILMEYSVDHILKAVGNVETNER